MRKKKVLEFTFSLKYESQGIYKVFVFFLNFLFHFHVTDAAVSCLTPVHAGLTLV